MLDQGRIGELEVVRRGHDDRIRSRLVRLIAEKDYLARAARGGSRDDGNLSPLPRAPTAATTSRFSSRSRLGNSPVPPTGMRACTPLSMQEPRDLLHALQIHLILFRKGGDEGRESHL